MTHYIFDVTKCRFDVDTVAPKFIEKVIDNIELTPVGPPVSYDFEPHGKTIVLVLKESHLIVHTWPEFGSVLIDFLPCVDTYGKNKIHRFTSTIKEIFEPESIKLTEITRDIEGD